MKAKMERKRNIYKLKYLLIKKPKKLDNVWFFSLLNSLWASANESNMESNILCLPCIRCEYTVKRPKSTLTHTIKDNTVRMQMFEMIRWCKQLPYLHLFHTFNEKKYIKRFWMLCWCFNCGLFSVSWNGASAPICLHNKHVFLFYFTFHTISLKCTQSFLC